MPPKYFCNRTQIAFKSFGFPWCKDSKGWYWQAIMGWVAEHRLRIGVFGSGGEHVTWPVIGHVGLEYSNCIEGLRANGVTLRIGLNSLASSSSVSSSTVWSSRCFLPPGGMSVCQLAAAPPIPSTTSWICGLRSLSRSQHFCMTSHKESEIPIAPAFAGLSGRAPRRTRYACS